MVKQEWNIDVENQAYNIKLNQGYFSVRKTILINDLIVEEGVESRQSILGNVDIDFKVDTHEIKVVGRSNGLSTKFDLFLDGISQSTGQPFESLPPIPAWLWIFIVACGAIPVISMGGAIPAVLGVGGAAICLSQGRDTKKAIQIRILICLGVTILAWLLLFFLVFGIAFFRN